MTKLELNRLKTTYAKLDDLFDYLDKVIPKTEDENVKSALQEVFESVESDVMMLGMQIQDIEEGE